MITEPPIGIIVTLPMRFFEEYDYRKYIREHEAMNDPENDSCWFRVMKNLPTWDVLYVYTCYGGRIRHRTNFGWLVRNEHLAFTRPEGGIRDFGKANAVVMVGPYVKAPIRIQQKGFQGFRYVIKELW